ncbi:hydroxyphenylacetyl-CoA thioesterase PaaI [Pseudonocardia sp. WMMC193]|uniref:hydroxyphenylacetyl-CoA thioesterase PaaI n=1 Tax=Pseudonocardia sp. WMMC193 TaxID=2911965 RepID=UPI001F01986C|nr:hydroxyphenylacetyl-CoA thioesterase PaaI [Pseudonocardia sp. WMMC193]MCF7551989.1 hydroxyphenylacetyl-CoA thioesterase PaaI [Pseudonocardia sp. WMMC193]
MDEQETAERVAAAMTAQDAAIRAAGIRLLDIGPGRARATMTVSESHLNGHGVAHGGYLFFLADAAFSFACNSRGVSTVAAGGDVSFLRAGRLGDELVAEARETALAGKSGIYDVTITAGDAVVAEFRGRSRAVPHLPPPYA